MEGQDGESANEVPVVRNYKHKESCNVRLTNLFPNLRPKHIQGFSAIYVSNMAMPSGLQNDAVY
jgi:hypothetical protein